MMTNKRLLFICLSFAIGSILTICNGNSTVSWDCTDSEHEYMEGFALKYVCNDNTYTLKGERPNLDSSNPKTLEELLQIPILAVGTMNGEEVCEFEFFENQSDSEIYSLSDLSESAIIAANEECGWKLPY